METLVVKGQTYDIMGENLICMDENNLKKVDITRRLMYGWTLNEACKAPKGTRLEKYREEQKTKQMESQRERQRKEAKEEKRRNERPWLYDGTPQVHPRCKYVADLMKYDAFPKVVK